jgi:hypothetical protein
MAGEMPADSQSEILVVLRAVVGPGFVIGGWQLMSASFGWVAFIVYAGFAIGLAECVWEPSLLRRSYQVQVACIGIVLLFVDLFTIGVVLTRAPITLDSIWTEPKYVLPDTGGIAWKSFFAELYIIFSNLETDITYDDFNVLVRPDRLVAGISQLSNLPEVFFEDRYGLLMHGFVEDGSTVVNMEFIGTDAGYKVHCAHIPPNASLRIVMAIAELKKPTPNQPILPPASPESILTGPTFTEKDGSKYVYWYGRKSNVGMFLPQPTAPAKITISGSYVGNHRVRRIEKDVAVGTRVVFR